VTLRCPVLPLPSIPAGCPPADQKQAAIDSCTKTIELSDRNACDVELLCVGCASRLLPPSLVGRAGACVGCRPRCVHVGWGGGGGQQGPRRHLAACPAAAAASLRQPPWHGGFIAGATTTQRQAGPRPARCALCAAPRRPPHAGLPSQRGGVPCSAAQFPLGEAEALAGGPAARGLLSAAGRLPSSPVLQRLLPAGGLHEQGGLRIG
jgi:hypothetical protein